MEDHKQKDIDEINMICCSQISLGGGVTSTSMAKPSVMIRADHNPMASHLSPDLSVSRAGPSSSRRPDLVFVVNPQGFVLGLFFD